MAAAIAKTPDEVRQEIEIENERLQLLRLREAEGDPEGSAFRRFAAGTSRGVAQTLGAPVDIVNSLLGVVGAGDEAPLGGSANIQSMLEKLGAGVAPEAELGRAGRVGELVGTTAAASPAIVGAGVRSATSALTDVAKAPKLITSLVQDIGRTAMRNPVTFSAVEGGSAALAGLAGYEAAQRFPDSPGAQALAEIAGGFSPAVVGIGVATAGPRIGRGLEKVPISGAVIRTVRGAIKAVSTPAQTTRSIARVQRATPDAGASARRLERQDVLPEAPLTAAQRAGDKDLLALEASVMQQNTDLSFARAQQFTEVNTAIRQSLVSTPVDDVPTHQVKSYLQELLDTRIKQAGAKADEALGRLGVDASAEDLNRLARLEVEGALTAARNQEKQLFGTIPDNAAVPTQAGREMLEHVRLTTPKAQRVDIPDEAVKHLSPTKVNAKGKKVANPDYLGNETTIEEVRGLQSKLREVGRVARADKQFNKARIADDFANALTDDIANSTGGPQVRESVDIAVAFSRDLNDRFTKGPVGRLLGLEKSGGQRVDPSLTLETTVGKRGLTGKVEGDKLLAAVERHGDEAVMREHIEGFLIDRFRNAAVAEGRIDVNAAQGWLRRNQQALSRYPELRRNIEQATAAGGRLVDAERLVDPKVSRAAVFINAPPGSEMERVIKTAQPRQAMAELVALARTDKSGKALEGLKASFYEMLLRKSQVIGSNKALDLGEKPFISGSLLSEQMSRDPVIEAARGLLTAAEMRRLNKTRETAILLERARSAQGAVEGVIGDQPNLLFGLLARVGGAQLGRVIAQRTGGGTVQTPGILAAETKRLLMAGVQDPAKRLLTDAMQDESLFKALLVPQAQITPRSEKAIRARMNAWVVEVLREQQEVEE